MKKLIKKWLDITTKDVQLSYPTTLANQQQKNFEINGSLTSVRSKLNGLKETVRAYIDLITNLKEEQRRGFDYLQNEIRTFNQRISSFEKYTIDNFEPRKPKKTATKKSRKSTKKK